MNIESPSTQEWKDLYDAAMEFQKIECWKYMSNPDLFGVQNPANGEIGYCCVMGELGEHFALGVYQGTEGLDGFTKIMTGEVTPGSFDSFLTQKCLMASFEDRKELQKEDRQVIKTLGLKFFGRNAWPLFRSYLPGHHPWFLTREEAKYLTLALQEAVVVALRFKENREMLVPPTEDHFLVRVPRKTEQGLEWTDEWLEPAPRDEAETVAPLDEERLAKINRKVSQRAGIWEIDSFYSPQGVREKQERPYYPYVTFYVEHDSELIVSMHMEKITEHKRAVGEHFVDLAESTEFLPQLIAVKNEEMFDLLEPIVTKLGVELRLVKRLPAFEEAQKAMFEMMGG